MNIKYFMIIIFFSKIVNIIQNIDYMIYKFE